VNELIKLLDQTELVIEPQTLSAPRPLHNDQIIVMDYELRVLCTLKANGHRVAQYGIILTATTMGGDPEELRKKLLAHPYLEIEIWDPKDSRPNWHDIQVRVEDPRGILAWLFPGGNFSYITQNLQRHGQQKLAEPLRLPPGAE
jgi:hypothetical protein